MLHTESILLSIKASLDDGNHTVAVAESLTSGMLQSLFADVSGISSCFAGGITAYNLDAKVNLLGVDRDHAASVDCVSEKVAIQMAQGVIKAFGADIAIGTTGYAEPYPAENIVEPFAYIAVVTNHMVLTKRIDGSCAPEPGRKSMRAFVASHAVNMLMKVLEKKTDLD